MPDAVFHLAAQSSVCQQTGKEVVTTSRELDGKLYAGHETFEWLLAVITYVMAAEVSCVGG